MNEPNVTTRHYSFSNNIDVWYQDRRNISTSEQSLVHAVVTIRDCSQISPLYASSTSLSSPLMELINSSAWDAEIRSAGLNLIRPWMTGRSCFRVCSWIRASNFCSSFERWEFSPTKEFHPSDSLQNKEWQETYRVGIRVRISKATYPILAPTPLVTPPRN